MPRLSPHRYIVDWSDQYYPEIRLAPPDTPFGDVKTLPQARQEIISHFQRQQEHARVQIARVRMLRVIDIEEES